jgi:hypothetical protein
MRKNRYMFEAVGGSRKKPTGWICYATTSDEAHRVASKKTRGTYYVRRITVTERFKINFMVARHEKIFEPSWGTK